MESRHTKLKTPIWSFYQKMPDNVSAQCKQCKKVLKTNFGSTSGLLRHLMQHPNLKKELEQIEATRKGGNIGEKTLEPTKKQLRLDEAYKWPSTHERAISLTNCIGEWIADAMLPYSTVENHKFQKVLKIAQPLYSVPSRNTFSRRVIPELYNKTKAKMSEHIANAISLSKIASLSFTCDLWTSASNEAFMSLTCHFIEDFDMKKYCLGCYSFPGGHTGEAISEKLVECFNEWDLENAGDKVDMYIVSDNGRNLKLGLSLCKLKFTQLQCFAHTLQLVLQDAVKVTCEIKEVLKKSRSIVGRYKHSVRATEQLHQIQEELDLPVLNLIQDCQTRWNSEFLMLKRLFDNKIPLSRHLPTLNMDNLQLSEWNLIDSYINILQPLYDATTQLCGERSPLASMVIPVIFSLKNCLKAYINTNAKQGWEFANEVLLALQARFPCYDRKEPYYTAMLVDPRFKAVVIPTEEKLLARNHLDKKVKEITQATAQPVTTAGTSELAQSSTSLWSVFDELAESESSNQIMSSETDCYFSMPVIQRSDDPLKWWREKGKDAFPNVCKVAMQYLGIPATETASERVFSSAGNIVSPKRMSLSSEHTEELVFIHENGGIS